MSLISRLMGLMAKLPRVETHDVVVEKDLEVPMPDGVILLADHYAPRNLGARPTLLMRSPYGERVRAGWMGQLLAEQGFHVLLQSCRGTFGSGGKFDPFRGEREDGEAVLAWLKHQGWFNGELATYGTSYSGFTAWAMAELSDSTLKALSTQITSADFRSMLYPGNALALEVFLGWMSTVQTGPGSLWHSLLNTLVSHTDFFVRVTDVEPSGKSMNVCDGLQRLAPGRPAQEGDGCLKVHIELFPTAYRFRRGHRIRLQMSSGSFPRWARNLGSGEPLASATTLCVAEQQVYHDPDHPSAVVLPIVDERQADQETEAR